MTKTIYLHLCPCPVNEKRECLENQEGLVLGFSSTFKQYFT